jgi:hypothetical protein
VGDCHDTGQFAQSTASQRPAPAQHDAFDDGVAASISLAAKLRSEHLPTIEFVAVDDKLGVSDLQAAVSDAPDVNPAAFIAAPAPCAGPADAPAPTLTSTCFP